MTELQFNFDHISPEEEPVLSGPPVRNLNTPGLLKWISGLHTVLAETGAWDQLDSQTHNELMLLAQAADEVKEPAEPPMPTPEEGEQVYRVRQLADAYLYFWTWVVAESPEHALDLVQNEDFDWVEDGDSGAFDQRNYEVYAADDESYDKILVSE